MELVGRRKVKEVGKKIEWKHGNQNAFCRCIYESSGNKAIRSLEINP